jgi:hypothetical protein
MMTKIQDRGQYYMRTMTENKGTVSRGDYVTGYGTISYEDHDPG